MLLQQDNSLVEFNNCLVTTDYETCKNVEGRCKASTTRKVSQESEAPFGINCTGQDRGHLLEQCPERCCGNGSCCYPDWDTCNQETCTQTRLHSPVSDDKGYPFTVPAEESAPEWYKTCYNGEQESNNCFEGEKCSSSKLRQATTSLFLN